MICFRNLIIFSTFSSTVNSWVLSSLSGFDWVISMGSLASHRKGVHLVKACFSGCILRVGKQTGHCQGTALAQSSWLSLTSFCSATLRVCMVHSFIQPVRLWIVSRYACAIPKACGMTSLQIFLTLIWNNFLHTSMRDNLVKKVSSNVTCLLCGVWHSLSLP